LFLSLAALTAIGLPAFAEDKTTAKEVITKGIEALGGEKMINKFSATVEKSKGTIQVMGMEIAFTSYRQSLSPDKMKQTVNIEVNGQQLAIQQVVNGDQVRMSIGGNDMSPDDDTKTQLIEATVLLRAARLVPLLEGKEFEVKLLDEKAKVGDKEAYVLTVKHKNLRESKLFFDAKTFLVIKLEKEGRNGQENGKQETFLSDFKKHDGMTLPMKVKILHEGKDFLEAEVVEIKLLETIDKAEFEVAK
jgi:hypothetical protein